MPGSGSSLKKASCSAMAVSNNLLFIADHRGDIHTLRCNVKNGILQVTPHAVMLRCMLSSRSRMSTSLSVHLPDQDCCLINTYCSSGSLVTF